MGLGAPWALWGPHGAPWGRMCGNLIYFSRIPALGPRVFKSLFAGLLVGHDPGPSQWSALGPTVVRIGLVYAPSTHAYQASAASERCHALHRYRETSSSPRVVVLLIFSKCDVIGYEDLRKSNAKSQMRPASHADAADVRPCLPLTSTPVELDQGHRHIG